MSALQTIALWILVAFTLGGIQGVCLLAFGLFLVLMMFLAFMVVVSGAKGFMERNRG